MKNFRLPAGKLKHRFLAIVLLSSLPFLAAVTITAFNFMTTSRSQLGEQIEFTTITLHDTLESLLRTNVGAYLSSKIETGHDLIDLYLNGDQTIESITRTLLSLNVGSTGYFYAIDSSGKVIFHPDSNIVGTDQSRKSPVDAQLKMREGYYEYEWQNTFEDSPRKKALYMTYIPELDWILTATSYRSEFIDIIDRQILKDTISTIKLGESGYSYIVDRSYNIIAHPYLEGSGAGGLVTDAEYKNIIEKLYTVGDGLISYDWRDSEGGRYQEKLVYAKYLEDFDWVVATSMYIDEINRPVTMMFMLIITAALIVAVALFFIVKHIIRSIEIPVSGIINTLKTASEGNLSIRALPRGPVEIRDLGLNLNVFIDSLETKTALLSASIEEKDRLFQEIQHRIKNNLQTIISLLNMQHEYTQKDESKNLLRDTMNRISVMAIVYDHMLKADSNFERDTLLLPDFLDDYISNVISSFQIDKSMLMIESDFDSLHIRRNNAISCGLILSELLTGSLLAHNGKGKNLLIKIGFKRISENEIRFYIKDNAETFSPAKWNRSLNPTGFFLVNILTEQLSGYGRVIGNTEFEYRISFSRNL